VFNVGSHDCAFSGSSDKRVDTLMFIHKVKQKDMDDGIIMVIIYEIDYGYGNNAIQCVSFLDLSILANAQRRLNSPNTVIALCRLTFPLVPFPTSSFFLDSTTYTQKLHA
jgi:hypothetical protein